MAVSSIFQRKAKPFIHEDYRRKDKRESDGKANKNADLPVLELLNISKQFGGLQAVENFSLKIKKGDLHCIIGPNGAGKTTVFKMITGIYPVNSGTVRFMGDDITGMSPYLRAQHGISIKMQIPGVFGELTLRENMRIVAERNDLIKGNQLDDEIDRLLKMVKIDHLGNPLVKNMSHGQQQWLEMAMALASNPDLLLLDEPAAGMGPEETEFTADLIKKLNDKGLTIIFIEHDMNFVRRIAKQVTVMHYGKKFAEGDIKEIEKDESVIQIYLGNV